MKRFDDPKAQTVAVWTEQVKKGTITITDEWREALRELNGIIAKDFATKGKSCA